MDREDWDEGARLGAEADTLAVPTPPPDLLTAALYYAALGLHVFPLRPRSKLPYPGSKGCLDGTPDQSLIYRWWLAAPESNIGISTGYRVDVIDLDGIDGIVSFPQMQGLPPIIGVVKTPRAGGWHHYIPASGIGNRAHVLPGIDIRGLGGYVVAPPSVLDEPKYHRPSMRDGWDRYRWTQPLTLG